MQCVWTTRSRDIPTCLVSADYEVPKKKPKPPPSTTTDVAVTDGGSSSGGSSSAGEGSESEGTSGSGGSSSGSSGGSSAASGSGGSGSGGSNSGSASAGSSSGGSSSAGGGSSSSSSSAGGGGSGGASHGSAVDYHSKESDSSPSPHKSHAGVMGLAAAAMLAGAVIAVAATRRKVRSSLVWVAFVLPQLVVRRSNLFTDVFLLFLIDCGGRTQACPGRFDKSTYKSL
jgi:hypothetical protein